MFTYVAVPYQAYALSGSSLIVGLLGVAELVPLMVAAMLGGCGRRPRPPPDGAADRLSWPGLGR